eukprot:216579-Hanusia_phi.AAC.5
MDDDAATASPPAFMQVWFMAAWHVEILMSWRKAARWVNRGSSVRSHHPTLRQARVVGSVHPVDPVVTHVDLARRQSPTANPQEQGAGLTGTA